MCPSKNDWQKRFACLAMHFDKWILNQLWGFMNTDQWVNYWIFSMSTQSYFINFIWGDNVRRRHHYAIPGNSNQHSTLLALWPKNRTNTWNHQKNSVTTWEANAKLNCTQNSSKLRRSIPQSEGNVSLGDLLSVNSVPRISPVPRICTKQDISKRHACMNRIFFLLE